MKSMPIPLLVIAAIFVVAPIGNFLISFYLQGFPGWYNPIVFLELAANVSLWDWLWNGLLMLSGAFLLTQKRAGWLFALFTLSLITVSNLILLSASTTSALITAHLAMCVVGTLGALSILFYFRYPFLDRREKVATPNVRVRVNLPAKILYGDEIEAQIANLSRTGAFIKCDTSTLQDLRLDQLIRFKMDLDFIGEGEVRHVQKDGFGIQFHGLSRQDQKKIAKIVEHELAAAP